jgi:hypothetical protein
MTFRRKSYQEKHICSYITKKADATENLTKAPGENLHQDDFIVVQVKVDSKSNTS